MRTTRLTLRGSAAEGSAAFGYRAANKPIAFPWLRAKGWSNVCVIFDGTDMERVGYRCEATTLEGFIQQLAVGYVSRGYVFYVTGWLPERKDPSEVDRRLVAKYGIDVSKWARARRKRAGYANLQYLRFERFFVILATPGRHPFFEQEAKLIRDCRETPIKFGGYAVGSTGRNARVRIEREQYNLLKAYFSELALRRSAANLERMIATLPFEPYAGVYRQKWGLVRAVNEIRKAAGYDLITPELRRKRRLVRPFDSTRLGNSVVNQGYEQFNKSKCDETVCGIGNQFKG